MSTETCDTLLHAHFEDGLKHERSSSVWGTGLQTVSPGKAVSRIEKETTVSEVITYTCYPSVTSEEESGEEDCSYTQQQNWEVQDEVFSV